MYQAIYYDKQSLLVNSVITAETLNKLYQTMREKENESLEIWFRDEYGSALCSQEI